MNERFIDELRWLGRPARRRSPAREGGSLVVRRYESVIYRLTAAAM